MLVVLVTPQAANASAPAAVMAASCSPGVPAQHCGQATIIYNFVVSHNYSPPAGYQGGGVYGNTNGLLPPPSGQYREYRLYTTPGSAQRLVIDDANPGGNSWFTPDHYATFAQFYLLA
jgi:guanyl-specific ribonuclease Sa